MLVKGKIINDRTGLTRYLVPHPAFRGYMRNLSLTAVVMFGAFTLLAWWYHRGLLEALAAFGALNDEGLRMVLLDHVRKSVLISTFAIGGSSLAFLLFSAYALHRICGPVYRLSRHMSEILNGAPPTAVRFRRGDAFEDLRANFNEFLRHAGLLEDARTPESSETEAARQGVVGEMTRASS